MYSAQAELHARSGKKIAMCRKVSFFILESRFQNSVRDCRLFCPVCQMWKQHRESILKSLQALKVDICCKFVQWKVERLKQFLQNIRRASCFAFDRTVGFTFTASTVEIETRSWPGTYCFVLLMDKTLHKYQFDLC